MAVVSIKESIASHNCEWSLQGGWRPTVVLNVQTDSIKDGPKAILASLGIKVGDTYRYPLTETPTEADNRLFVQSVSINRLEAVRHPGGAYGLFAEVSVVYQAVDPEYDDRGPVDENGIRQPFLAPPRVRWATEFEDFAVTHTRLGNPILNKAGDPFDPPLTVPMATPVAIISRVEREFSPDWINTFKGRTNSSPWMGWPEGSVLCRDITAEREWNNDFGGWTWPTEYQFAIRPPVVVSSKVIYPGWAVQVLNAGMRQLASAPVGPPKKTPCQFDGAPAFSPVPLDDDGKQLSPEADPVYLTFDLYPRADFSALDLPVDLFTVGTPGI